MFVERWKEFAPTEIQVSPLAIDSLSFENLQAKWKQPSMGVPISINHGAVNGMIVAESSRDSRVVDGDPLRIVTEKPADRELTSVETSLCQLLFEQSRRHIRRGLAEQRNIADRNWKTMDWHPNRCRLFPPNMKCW